MHGVRLVSTPPTNSAGSASAGLPLSICAIEPLCTGMGNEVGGLTGATDASSHPLRRYRITQEASCHRSPTHRAAGPFAAPRCWLCSRSPFSLRSRPACARAQTTSARSNGTVMDDPAALHLTMTPRRPATPTDSARAAAVAAELRRAILRYADTTAAVADGFRMFAPQIKNQKVYHFTRGLNAIQEAFRFDPTKPTSLLYQKGADGASRPRGRDVHGAEAVLASTSSTSGCPSRSRAGTSTSTGVSRLGARPRGGSSERTAIRCSDPRVPSPPGRRATPSAACSTSRRSAGWCTRT